MKVDTYKCDVCGKTKGDVNHWWTLVVVAGQLILAPWSDANAAEQENGHLCGAECVQKKVSEFLGTK